MLPSATQPNWSMNFSSPALEHFSDVQDHTKLKAAWEAMLTHRFLAPQLVTVLPFYLSSTFIDVRTHNALHIPLPPNSRPKKPAGSPVDGPAYRQDSLDPEAVFRMQSSSRSSKASDEDSMTSPRSPRLIPSWAPMHLAKTVRTVIACKESIWIEYERLYGNDPSVPPVARRFNRTGRGNQKEVISMERQSVRENFETEWLHWEQ